MRLKAGAGVINAAECRDSQLRAFGNTAMNLQVSQTAGNFLAN
jgi:hypothetical protein